MILINFEGGVIAGTSQSVGYENWINVESIQWGVGRAINIVAEGKDRDTSNPNFSELTFTRKTDQASTDLFMQATAGVSLTGLDIVLLNTSGTGGTPQVYQHIHVHDPIISAYTQSSGGDRPSETFSVNFNQFEMRYDLFDEGGTLIQGTAQGWNTMKGQKEVLKL